MVEYKEKYLDIRRKTTLRKVETVKEIIQSLFPEIKSKKIMLMLSRCAHYHYDKKRELDTEERMLYDILLKYNYNPFRVYKWFRISLLPEDVKEEVEKGTLSQEKAMKIYVNRYRTKEASMSWKFMEEARRIIKEVII